MLTLGVLAQNPVAHPSRQGTLLYGLADGMLAKLQAPFKQVNPYVVGCAVQAGGSGICGAGVSIQGLVYQSR